LHILLTVEQQLEREWWWLQGALNATAELRLPRPATAESGMPSRIT
jgi:hypothetical protein